MAPAQPCAKYQYVVTPTGPKILPVEDLSCKDEESPAEYNAGGYLPVNVGDTFKNGRYHVVRKLGWGHFSTVWLVKDTQEHKHSALKVVKSAGRYAETARDEIKLLSRVASFSPTHPGRSHIVSFLDSFVNQGPESCHVCIVFEPLGENLLGLIERNKKKGVPRALVRLIAKQMLLGLQYLHDECDLVHTDIKPENILISIPDIETHIHTELSQSPTPTSRRVGIPRPAKTRAGVSIPQSQQRARRQVQIFDSQPLASPGRSVDLSRRGGPASLSVSVNAHHGHDGSGGSSISSSYFAQIHLSRMTGSGTTASGTAKSLSSAASKFTGGFSTSAPQPEETTMSDPDSRRLSTSDLSGKNHNPLSPPSTSSSSSSISSTLASITAGSSSVMSTPPTSLSNSLGNAVAGFIGISKMANQSWTSASSIGGSSYSREGIPVMERHGKDKGSLENEIEEATSMSWKDAARKPGSWTNRIPSALSSSYKSPIPIPRKSKLCQVQSSPHSQPRLSVPSSSFWKDPGTAAPAPAVVVSVIAGADSGDDTGVCFDFTGTTGIGGPSVSESSSATATTARPSRISTPVDKSPSKKPSLLLNGPKKVTDTNITSFFSSSEPCSAETDTHPIHMVPKSGPSLLTQTAPMRITHSSTTQLSNAWPSPPYHASQISTHNHRNLITCICPNQPHDLNTTYLTQPSPTSFSGQHSSATSFTPAHMAPSPSAPPPTPVDSPSISSLIPPPQPTPTRPHAPTIQVPISIPSLLPTTPPPISIKIADLGNATPSIKHYTEDIQTRQYRAPEAILGKRDWDTRVDIWSVACVVFELLTSEFLFDPHGQGERFTKDDDHMAQIIELLGDFPLEIKMGGRYSRELFDHAGGLRYIQELRPWPLKRVMMEKYLYNDADATALADFLLPMLVVDMKQRSHARDMLDHAWLTPSSDDELVVDW